MRQKMHQHFRQALGVKVTLPGAEPELQAEKDTWFLIDRKWFNIFSCGRSHCEMLDSSSMDSEGSEPLTAAESLPPLPMAPGFTWKWPGKVALAHQGC